VQAVVLAGLGVTYQKLGNFAKAKDHAERGLALYREVGDR
jgi:hypothetical protein